MRKVTLWSVTRLRLAVGYDKDSSLNDGEELGSKQASANRHVRPSKIYRKSYTKTPSDSLAAPIGNTHTAPNANLAEVKV